ncbi:hypothetical protein MIND_00181300 [Mycena indigotica]|uniref:C2H2-type domain-containing protein n=1 Tax=Mycena indigotica TaxID=2126181 RepID=A0A8H6WAL7_9AGAR|nr:uncharacterized protein MIND_00181300 [Mycena indigotica]KAF7311714.1 hypothetical protein MIND_00181300 [Mycena indigotica]
MTVYCDRCDRYFPHYGALAQHERASSAHWLCDDCEIDYTTWTGLKEHYVQSRRHFYCQHCDEHFDDGGELAEHMDDAHFYCSSCERVFKNEQGLHEHCRQSSVHHYCTPCRRLFTSANNLNAHMNSALHKPRHDHVPRPRLRAVLHQRPVARRASRGGQLRVGREPAVAQPLHPRAGHAQRDHRPRAPDRRGGERQHALRRDRAQLERHRVRVLPLPRQVPPRCPGLISTSRAPRHEEQTYICRGPGCSRRFQTLRRCGRMSTASSVVSRRCGEARDGRAVGPVAEDEDCELEGQRRNSMKAETFTVCTNR